MGNVSEALNSESVRLAISKMWATMIFLVVMGALSLIGIIAFKSELKGIPLKVAFFSWLVTMLVTTFLGMRILLLDARKRLAHEA